MRCPAKSPLRCSIDEIVIRRQGSAVTAMHLTRTKLFHDSITSSCSSLSHRAFRRTALSFIRLFPCSPLVQHSKTTGSSRPSTFVTRISSRSSGSEGSILIAIAVGSGPPKSALGQICIPGTSEIDAHMYFQILGRKRSPPED